MGLVPFDDDDTAPVPCGCAACLERARLRESVSAKGITRLTAIHSPQSQRAPWTVYLGEGETVRARGSGTTEEEAIETALKSLGEEA